MLTSRTLTLCACSDFSCCVAALLANVMYLCAYDASCRSWGKLFLNSGRLYNYTLARTASIAVHSSSCGCHDEERALTLYEAFDWWKLVQVGKVCVGAGA